MDQLAWTFETDVRVRVVHVARRLDYNTPVFGVRFNISNSTVHFLAPSNSYESGPARFTRQLTMPMGYYVNGAVAYQHCCYVLSMINAINPHAIPVTAQEIASKLQRLSLHAIQVGLINWVRVEIRLDIKRYVWYRAALDWAFLTTERESMDRTELQPVVSGGLFRSSSSDEVDEFLRSSRVQTWDSKTDCAICLACLGGDGEEKEEEVEEEVAVVISLPCSHFFHGRCISRWFEVSYSCPLCRRIVDINP